MKLDIAAPVVLPTWRRVMLLMVMLLIFVALVGRSLYLQTFQADFLQERSAARYERDIILPSFRGKILDRNNKLLARSTPVKTVSADPRLVEIDDAQLTALAKLLNRKKSYLKKKLSKKNEMHAYLRRKIDPEIAKKVMQLEIPGIYLQQEYKRFYPKGEEIAHVVGLQGNGEDKEHPTVGFVGLELQFNEQLKGEHGKRTIVKDRDGRVMEDLKAIVRPKDGMDVVLSINNNIQYYAYRELIKGVEAAKAKAGSAIVLDAKKGEVLAMAVVPSFNPNHLTGNISLKNTTVSDVFEPGSTMKPFAVAAALEAGYISPETKIDTGKGYLKFKEYTIRDTKPHGVITASEVLQMSSNVGSAKIAEKMGKTTLWKMYKKLGFGERTNIEFPGESAGIFKDLDEMNNTTDLAAMSYGNAISVTLLQIARAYTVFANDGVLLPVTLKKRKRAPVGKMVLSEKTARQVRTMLETVVLEGGTAPRAKVAGYSVAGKTGTSRKVRSDGRGYEQGKYISSFIGMAPVSDPELIMVVMIDEPDTTTNEYYGGNVAAPVFSTVMRESLNGLGVKKDKAIDNVVLVSEPDEVLH